MNKLIFVRDENCIKCGKCAKVCPASILIQKQKGEAIRVEYVDTCIACGHCVDVCPTASVVHSDFPPEKLHPIDYSLLPTPDQVMALIKTRRSNRAITSRPIPREALDRIVEAARFAPTASNERNVSFTVITDPEKLRQISDFTIDQFNSSARILMNPIVKVLLKPFLKHIYDILPAFYRFKQEHKAGNDPILRKATALLVIHTPASSEFGCENANLAYQNASLMAHSLGVSQIYMGFVINAIRKGGKGTFSRITGIHGKVHAIMALGIPAFRFPQYTE